MIELSRFQTHELQLHSKLMEWLEQLPMNAAKVNQWQTTIQNAKGIRQEEIDQAGVGELLIQFADNHKLSKKEFLNHIEENLRACMPILGSEHARQYSPTLLYKKIPVESLPPKVIRLRGFIQIRLRQGGDISTPECRSSHPDTQATGKA
jgi:hypothetical protein